MFQAPQYSQRPRQRPLVRPRPDLAPVHRQGLPGDAVVLGKSFEIFKLFFKKNVWQKVRGERRRHQLPRQREAHLVRSARGGRRGGAEGEGQQRGLQLIRYYNRARPSQRIIIIPGHAGGQGYEPPPPASRSHCSNVQTLCSRHPPIPPQPSKFEGSVPSYEIN